mgnify:CR=1 FL=1
MRSVRRSALVPYEPAQMYDLVDDIPAYPECLPWCTQAEVLERDGNTVAATLELSKGGMRRAFTSRNVGTPSEKMEMHLVDGPFSHLEGVRTFLPLGDSDCKASLSIDFEFSSPVLGMMLGGFFETTCNELVDAFTKRAEAGSG